MEKRKLQFYLTITTRSYPVFSNAHNDSHRSYTELSGLE